MGEYRFLTTWLLESPRQPVWDAIYDSESWPEWWHGVLEAEKLEEGDASGVGRWRLFEETSGGNPVTAALYEWNVRTTRAWMNLLAPVARPVFAVNHDYVMRNGGEGLAKLLGCRLLASD